MHATLDVNSEEKLLESVTMLRHARRIVITGIGGLWAGGAKFCLEATEDWH
ncbi:transcriptional regulator [Salmonella enterica subsp. enterica serovar Typhimurium]|nr:transcriptional regulator [Salmonella enterica subsp. enterica serovar Typhimurium]